MEYFKQIVLPDGYVLTPCKNAFNDKISFWLSKHGMTQAMYCFSVRKEDQAEYAYQAHHMRGYIDCYKKTIENK